MKNWFHKRKVDKLRNKLLRAKEDQMHHRLMAQHHNDVIHDLESELDSVGALHTEHNLISLDLERPHATKQESKIITVAS